VTTDIAHDLRTPLTRLRNRLELARRPDADAAVLRAIVDDAYRETDVILDIFAALLRIAQIESGARRAGFTRVDAGEVLDTVLELYRPAAEERQQQLDEAISPGLMVTGDRELLTQLFANLLENALRHSPPGALVHVAARDSGARIEIAVSDCGPGIPEAMRAKVLQRFFRLEDSRTTPGSGLGLSLASAIVKLHSATMTLADNQPGLCVRVSFAKAVQIG
jgi:signal transduction histidine kinase